MCYNSVMVNGRFSAILTESFLRSQYLEEGKTSDQIGAAVGCSGRMVRYYLQSVGITSLMRPVKPEIEALLRSGEASRFRKGNSGGYRPPRGEVPSWTKDPAKRAAASAKIAAAKRGKARPDITGSLHPLWNGGSTTANMLIRRSNAYRRWRTAVFERDDFTCQRCGQRGGRLEANHIKEFATHPDLRLDIDNGETLCRPCHRPSRKSKVHQLSTTPNHPPS